VCIFPSAQKFGNIFGIRTKTFLKEIIKLSPRRYLKCLINEGKRVINNISERALL